MSCPRTGSPRSTGLPSALITTRVDVSDLLDRKRAALRAHASQIDETSFFLALPDEVFAVAFGTEWFIRVGAPRAEGAAMGGDLFAGVPVS